MGTHWLSSASVNHSLISLSALPGLVSDPWMMFLIIFVLQKRALRQSLVPSNVNGKVSSDGSWGTVQRVGSTNQSTCCSDHTLSLEHNSNNRSRGKEVYETREETLSVVLCVMGLSELQMHKYKRYYFLTHLLGGSNKLQCNELESFALELSNNFSYLQLVKGVHKEECLQVRVELRQV